jgi:cation transport ATPase
MEIMSSATVVEQFWTDEPSGRPGRRKIRTRIGGLYCSLCTGTIEKARGRLPGVDKFAVSLTHEEALVEFDPAVAKPAQILQTLKDIGYTISDPTKLRPYEDEERDLVRESRRFVGAVGFSLVVLALIATPGTIWGLLLGGLIFVSLTGFAFLVLTPAGPGIAAAGSALLASRTIGIF